MTSTTLPLAAEIELLSSKEANNVHPYAEHGPAVDHGKSNPGDTKGPDLFWSRVRRACRDPFSEFLGTFILILFGNGSVAQVVLSNGQKGDYQSISWGWG